MDRGSSRADSTGADYPRDAGNEVRTVTLVITPAQAEMIRAALVRDALHYTSNAEYVKRIALANLLKMQEEVSS
jgi:hypothetical protein